jgi:thioredoxin 1
LTGFAQFSYSCHADLARQGGGVGFFTAGEMKMSQEVQEFTDANFEAEVITSDKPVLVDFWAEWCGPCRLLTPKIEQMARDFDGRVKFGKLDTDANRDTAMKYGISAIPTVILFKDGQPAQRIVGLRENEIRQALESA